MKKKEVDISARMRALTRLVTPGRIVCDIGCDHGFVSIYLVQKNIAPKVFAMDVRSGPLSQAQSHIEQYGLVNEIETRLSDGLTKLAVGEAECMVCAGMGGPLMIKILEEGRAQALAMKELVLQPQSEIEEFRVYLRTNGYHLVEEDMVFEDGKYYPMMKVVPVSDPVSDQQGAKEQVVFDRFGEYLLKQKNPVLKQYLDFSEEMTETLIARLKEQSGERAQARLPKLEQDLELIHVAKEYFKM